MSRTRPVRMQLGRILALLCLFAALGVPGAVSATVAQQPVTTPFTLSTGTPRTSEQQSVRFDKADLAIRVFPDDKRIEGTAQLEFTTIAALDQLQLELDAGFRIGSISVDGIDIPQGTGWRNDGGRLTIPFDRERTDGQSFRIEISWAGRPHIARNPPWDGGFVWSTTPDGRPWIATAVQGEGCDLFWPCIDHPKGKPGRIDLHITVPAGLSAPSNGRLVAKIDNADGTTTWSWTARDAGTYAVALNIGPYEELADEYQSRFGNRFPLRFWHLPTAPEGAPEALFAELTPMLDFYEATIGPFPFADEKVGVVETPHLGMEHQTINAYGNAYRLDGRGYDWLLQHELAHEWFGNQMTNENWDDMWLHEGLGTYMQPLYARWLNGERYMEAELAEMRKSLINRFPLVSGQPKDSGSVYDQTTGPGLDLYYKGALVAHSLKLLMGDEAFFRALRHLVYGRADPAPGNFTPIYRSTREFIHFVNLEAGQDLNWFFDTYVFQAALPRLVLTRSDHEATLTWGDVQNPFPMPVEIEIDGEIQVLDMTLGSQTIEVPSRAHILVDPRNRVLRHLDFIEAFRFSNR